MLRSILGLEEIKVIKEEFQKIKKKLTDLKKDVNVGDKSEEKKK